MPQRKFLITSALPYANGPIHFGHLVGAYLSADVYNRHRKLQGHETLFISGSDEHGVAIMLNAKKADKDYQSYVDHWHKEHSLLFKKMNVDFDFFGQTSAEYHEEEVLKWFENLNEKGLIEPQDMQQLYCNDCHNHLPDRFVEGTCYACDFETARGDECPNCGELINPVKLKEPTCKICESKNIKEVTTTQYYLMLSKYHKEFRAYFDSRKPFWRKTVHPYVNSLTEENLHDRAITRDLDWGIDLPLPNTKGKKLYVWFDAPIGYVSNSKEFFKQAKRSDDYLKDWWNNDNVELSHFIGKDNIIFHTIIFPVMSLASGIARPADLVPANQFLNLEGKQFSKSTGHYIDALEACDEFGQTALRYYLLSILPESTDSSFSWEQFQAKLNNELANNIGNFMNRCLKFTQKNWESGLPTQSYNGFIQSDHAKQLKEDIKELHSYLDEQSFKKGIEKLMSIGHKANNYFSENAPWAVIKEDKEKAAQILGYSSIFALVLGSLFQPFLPELSVNILNHFKNIANSDMIQKLYNGDLEIIEEIFKNGHKIEGTVEAMVPKIADEVIKEKLSSLA